MDKGCAHPCWPLPPGMTVEVLGTVLGTAIQGQIVGKVDTPCIGSPFFFGLSNSSVAMEEVNMTHDTESLTDTVRWGSPALCSPQAWDEPLP